MIQKTWVVVLSSVLVSFLVKEGQVCAAGTKKIVVFFDGISSQVQQTIVEEVGAKVGGIRVVHPLSFINALAIEVLNTDQVDRAVALLGSYTILKIVKEVDDDLVVSVNPVIPAEHDEIPSTETYWWGLQHIRVGDAHQAMPGRTGQGVKVAIVDTGVGNTTLGGCTHPDLALIVDGFNALPGGGSFCDNHGHGTHIAGIIAAEDNGLVIKGAAPQASIVPVKVLDDNGKGHLSDLINGLQWIWSYNKSYNNEPLKKIRLINLSLGFQRASPPLNDAIKELSADPDIIMVASAGNSCSDDGDASEDGGAEGGEPKCDTPQTNDDIKYPAQYDGVLAVTAIDVNYLITDYSPMGGQLDIAAPGGYLTETSHETAILSTCVPQSLSGTLYDCHLGYGFGSGTSHAAAHVTGALALKLQGSQISFNEVQDLLRDKARKKLGSYSPAEQGWGLIDVPCLLDPTSSQCPPP